MSAGENLKKNLLRLVEKQESVSEASGITQQYVSDLMTGRRVNPKLKTLELIAKALSVTVAELLAEPGSPKVRPPEESAYVDSKETELCRMLRAVLDHGEPEASWIAGNILTFFNQVIATGKKPSKKGKRAGQGNGRKKKLA